VRAYGDFSPAVGHGPPPWGCFGGRVTGKLIRVIQALIRDHCDNEDAGQNRRAVPKIANGVGTADDDQFKRGHNEHHMLTKNPGDL
jgi:hypothetical protein